MEIGEISGNITVNSKNTGGKSQASAFFGNTLDADRITSTISISANGKIDALAFGVYNSNNMKINNFTEKMTLTAVSNGGADTYGGAYGFCAYNGQIDIGGISGDMKLSATGCRGEAFAFYANTVKLANFNSKCTITANSTIAGKETTVQGVFATNLVWQNSSPTVTLSGTSKSGSTLFGVKTDNAEVRSEQIGIWNLKASGSASNVIGWLADDSFKHTGRIEGKISIDSAGGAIGFFAKNLDAGSWDESGNFTSSGGATVFHMDVQTKAVNESSAFRLYSAGEFVFEDSKISAKSTKGAARAIYCDDTMSQLVRLTGKTTVTGDICLGDNNDTFELESGARSSGLLDLGNGTDSVTLHGGAKHSGLIAGAEELIFEFGDIDFAKTTMLDGADPAAMEGTRVILDIEDLVEGDFAIFKGKNGWTNSTSYFDSVTLRVGGVEIGTLERDNPDSMLNPSNSPMEYSLSTKNNHSGCAQTAITSADTDSFHHSYALRSDAGARFFNGKKPFCTKRIKVKNGRARHVFRLKRIKMQKKRLFYEKATIPGLTIGFGKSIIRAEPRGAKPRTRTR